MDYGDGLGACRPAPSSNSSWFVYVGSAAVRATKTWDLGGSAPDPYVCFQVPGYPAECSAKIDDTYTPDWGVYSQYAYPFDALASVTFTLYDDDVGVDDVIDTYVLDMRSLVAGPYWVVMGDHSANATSFSDSMTVAVVPAP